jgi:hypothetical protein
VSDSDGRSIFEGTCAIFRTPRSAHDLVIVRQQPSDAAKADHDAERSAERGSPDERVGLGYTLLGLRDLTVRLSR